MFMTKTSHLIFFHGIVTCRKISQRVISKRVLRILFGLFTYYVRFEHILKE